MVTNVTSLLKTVKAVEDEATKGTRALEATTEHIRQELAVSPPVQQGLGWGAGPGLENGAWAGAAGPGLVQQGLGWRTGPGLENGAWAGAAGPGLENGAWAGAAGPGLENGAWAGEWGLGWGAGPGLGSGVWVDCEHTCAAHTHTKTLTRSLLPLPDFLCMLRCVSLPRLFPPWHLTPTLFVPPPQLSLASQLPHSGVTS